MTSLFLDRVRVALAEMQRSLPSLMLSSLPARTNLALDGYVDVPESACTILRQRLKDGPKSLMTAFWRTFLAEVPVFIPVKARLYLLPPESIIGNEETAHRYDPYGIGSGTIGKPVSLPFPAMLRNFQGEHSGYYDDVTVFGFDEVCLRYLAELLVPGSTITFIVPKQQHHFWMRWAELETDYAKLLDSVSQAYAVQPLHEKSTENVTVLVFGVSARAS